MSRSVLVECENRSQYCYMVAWCEEHGFGTPKKPVPLGCYPIILDINRDYSTATWTSSMSGAQYENESYITFDEFTDCDVSTDALKFDCHSRSKQKDSQPSPEQPVESTTWTVLKWWQQIKRGDKFLDLPTDHWVPCINLVGFLVWDLIVIRPSKAPTT